jgi:hypothetical protein
LPSASVSASTRMERAALVATMRAIWGEYVGQHVQDDNVGSKLTFPLSFVGAWPMREA